MLHILLAWALRLFSVTTPVVNVENSGLMRIDQMSYFTTLAFMNSFVKILVFRVLVFILISPVYHQGVGTNPSCNKLPVALLLQFVGGHVGGDGVVYDHVVQRYVLPRHQLYHLVGSHTTKECCH